MPRIVAVVGAFALIVCSIAYNMWRYPIDRHMTGRSSHLSQSSEPSQPVAAPKSTPAEPPSDKSARTYQCKIPPAVSRDVPQPAADWPEVDNLADDCDAQRPAKVAPSTKYTANAEPPESSEPESPEPLAVARSDRRLVPVVRPDVRQEPPGLENILRLPLVDDARSVAPQRRRSQSAGNSIPFYPTTGI